MAKKAAAVGGLQELKNALKNKAPERLYIFHGEEVFLLNHYLGQMKKLLLDPLTESFNFHRMNQETFDMRGFIDAVENLPMMAEATLVQVDEIDLANLRAGDTLSYTLDAHGETVFSGKVKEIRPIGSARQNATYFDVRVTIDTEKLVLPGMNGTVTIGE